ncbi:MAG: helix-turn-helix domain-containing protein [Planctomycetota bacterium]|nr:helix-turn-helix domain-containing protein [Planctomycetota bacterium]
MRIVSKTEVRFDPRPAHLTECSMQTAARERWGPNSRCVASTIPYQALFFVVDGKAWFSTRGRASRVGKGDIFCCGPGVGHEIWCDETSELDLLLLRFVGSASRQLMIESMGDTNLVCRPSKPLELQALMENLLGVAQAKAPLFEEICVQYLKIILLTIKSSLVPARKASSKAYDSFDACRRYMDRHYEQMGSAQDAAQACGLEHAYMCRLFRRFLGTSPHAYWLRLRMNLAAHLLQTSNQSVKRIANRFQFSDAHAFSKSFKRVLGVAPDKYRSSFPPNGGGEGP